MSLSLVSLKDSLLMSAQAGGPALQSSFSYPSLVPIAILFVKLQGIQIYKSVRVLGEC